MIDPRGMKVFLAVCRANSISGGARLLNISQPSVSSAIALLEKAVGAVLFARTHQGIVLTKEGEVLHRRAQALDQLLSDAAEELRLTRSGVAGPLRIGGTPGALVSLLPDAVERLGARIGRLDLRVVERPDHDLTRMLRSGEIELAFVTTALGEVPDDIEEVTFSQDPFALVVGRQNDYLPASLSLRDITGMGWVLPEAQGAFRRQIDALFVASDIAAPQDVIRCDSLLTTKAVVRGGARVTILPMKVASAELSIGVLRAITIREATFPRSIGVRRLAGARMSLVGQGLLDALAHRDSLWRS